MIVPLKTGSTQSRVRSIYYLWCYPAVQHLTASAGVVSRGQTAFFRVLGGGKKGSGATPIAIYF